MKKLEPYKIVCYYGAWSVYRPEPFNFGVNDIDPFSCTHLIYSFAGLDPDNLTIVSLDVEEDIVKGKACHFDYLTDNSLYFPFEHDLQIKIHSSVSECKRSMILGQESYRNEFQSCPR